MVSFHQVFAASLWASAVLSAPAPVAEPLSTRDISIDASGPPEGWTPIYAIDLYPDGIFDGVPVNKSAIWGYEPPAGASKAMQKRDPELSSPKVLGKREYTRTCYNSGNWVPQVQLQSGKSGFCGDINNAGGLGSGQFKDQAKLWYQASDGSFQRFTNQNGDLATVWYYVKVRDGFVWSYNNCFNALFEVIWNCRGSNPDSAGGASWEYNGAVDATVDPWE